MSALIVSTPFACCVSPIDHTKTALGRSISSCANSSMRLRVMPLAASMPVQLSATATARQIKVGRPVAHEPLVNAPAFDERAKHAQKSRVTAGVDVEPVVRQCGPRRALRAIDGINAEPVPARGGVDDRDLRAVLLRVMQVSSW